MRSSDKLPPYVIVNLLGRFRGCLLNLYRGLFPGSVALYEQFQSFWLLQPLFIAAELDIAGHLKNGPLTTAELAERTNTHPEALYRILRALASNGIFREMKGRRFRLNGQSKALLKGEGSMRNVIIHHLGKINWSANGNLLHTVKTGENAFTGLFGRDIYSYLREHQDELERFEQSMSDLSALGLAPVLKRYDFSDFRTIADIGGGEGFLLAKILQKYPGLKGLLFDLPENGIKAEAYIKSEGLEQRMQFVPGSFFESFHLEADAYLLKNVLHNWDDENCIRILTNIRKTMQTKSRVLILEMVIPGPGSGSFSRMVDIQMLATMPGGRERTPAGYSHILEKSGLRLKRIIPTIAPLSILESVGE